MLDKRLNDMGRIEISESEILISGFDANDCMCREVAILACLWAIGELQREVESLIRGPGGIKSAMD